MSCTIFIKSSVLVPIFPQHWTPPLFIFMCVELCHFLSPPTFSGFVPKPKKCLSGWAHLLTRLTHFYHPHSWQGPVITGVSQECPWPSAVQHGRPPQLPLVTVSKHVRGHSDAFEGSSWVPQQERSLYPKSGGAPPGHPRSIMISRAAARMQCRPGMKKEWSLGGEKEQELHKLRDWWEVGKTTTRWKHVLGTMSDTT